MNKGYLVCKKCGGYYKLQEGESPDEFEYCECGGKLEYHEFLQGYLKSEKIFEDLNDQNNFLIKSTKFEDSDEKEKLLMEMELLKEVKGENLKANKNLKYRIMAEALLIILLGFIGILTISYAYYLFLMAISTIIFGTLLLLFSMEKYYNRGRLKQILLLNGINLAIFSLMCVIFIFLALFQGNFVLFINGHYYGFGTFLPPIFYLIILAALYGIFSYGMFENLALPDYYDNNEHYIPLDNQMHHIDKNSPYGKRK